MNPIFWALVLLGMVVLWLLMRDLFVDIGSAVRNLIEDTADVLKTNELADIYDLEERDGGNENE